MHADVHGDVEDAVAKFCLCLDVCKVDDVTQLSNSVSPFFLMSGSFTFGY